MEIIDTHMHLFGINYPNLKYIWLEDEFVDEHHLRERLEGIKNFEFNAEDFIYEVRNCNVTKAVHVQAAIGTEDPVIETKYIQEQTDKTGYPIVAIADASLADNNIEDTLERHAAFSCFRGIRDFGGGNPDYLENKEWQEGYSKLEKYGPIFCANILWEDMKKGAMLASKFPNITFIVDHTGYPQQRDDEYFQNWKNAISEISKVENVWIKISGLGMSDWSWTSETNKPWVEHSVESFGVNRVIWGSNWPVDKLFGMYESLVYSYRKLWENFSDEEKNKMFKKNAEELFKF